MSSPDNPFPPPPGGPWQPSAVASGIDLDGERWQDAHPSADRPYDPDRWAERNAVGLGLVLAAVSVLGALGLVGALVWGVTA